jgi:hypothetical protein
MQKGKIKQGVPARQLLKTLKMADEVVVAKKFL